MRDHAGAHADMYVHADRDADAHTDAAAHANPEAYADAHADAHGHVHRAADGRAGAARPAADIEPLVAVASLFLIVGVVAFIAGRAGR